MKPLALLFLGMLREWVTSKKVLTAILTATVGALIVDPAWRDRVIAIGLALLGAQAANDVGKAKAQIEADNPKPVPLPASVVSVNVESSGPISTATLP